MAILNTQKTREIQDQLQKMPPANWVTSMVRDYYRTGSYRPSDLRRILGDQNRSVESGPKTCIAEHILEKK